MKLSFNTFRKCLLPAVTFISLAVPTKTAKDNINSDFSNLPKIDDKEILKKELASLTIVADTNFVGGINHRFDDESIQKLKKRIYTPDFMLEYKAPIKNEKNVYLEPFGYFFANRPNNNKKRPHMGLDIFVSPLSKKPKTPVLVQAPVDGVIISHKRARSTDNVVGNRVTLLGKDGRRYSFDHLARPTDYPDSIPMPTVGTIMKAGDPIGYVGSTGETTLWHLHLNVMTDEALKKQQSSIFWKKIAEQSPYSSLCGQVNPLSNKDAGPIANELCKYKGAKPDAKGDFNLAK